ncbi:MAG: CidA/LrgA family protein [Paramuribaculum sp.]|nr:CidA/LrgA family protein [Paramuribaculum sp.]MDE6324189.1 CidA/LrgA family protein [Paramuribaculum sp.]MDE6488551.1 CidA/LrgA family protein [Paramuribaculum sp.]
MAKQFGIIFACLAVGELIALIPGLHIPGSIWGLLLLAGLLEKGIVNPRTVAPVCKFLISNMAFFFIPPGVALMLYFDLIAVQWLPITVATVGSIVVVLLVTGRLHQFLHSYMKQRHGRH